MTRYVEIDKLRPNSWFLNRKKLELIRQVWREGKQHLLLAVLVTTIDNELSLLDGHCRAFVAWENGALAVLANIEVIDRISGPKDLYTAFHRQAPIVGVRYVADLGKRIYDLAEATDPDIAVTVAEV